MSLEFAKEIMPSLIRGSGQTLYIFVLTLVFSLPLGLPITLMSMSKFKPAKWLADFYILVFRGTPLMLQLFFIYYYVPQVFPIAYGRMTAALITFTLNYAAYFAEIYRAGIESIDSGQLEAAKSLGFSPWKTTRLIVIPQAIRVIIPPVSNEVITLVKDTALVNAIGITELLKAAKDATNVRTDPSAYLFAAIFYLFFTMVLTYISKKLEEKYSKFNREARA